MKISIVTTTYNSASTIRDTLESVLRQDYDDYEHIIVDGKSDDSTLDIVRHYEPLYQGRLKWVSEADKGIYDAMNKGIKLASGDIIGILNSDDFYSDSHVLSDIVKAIDGKDAVYADIVYVDHDDISRKVRLYSSAGFKTWQFRLGLMPAHPSFYCRRTVYERTGIYSTEFKLAADFEFLLRAYSGSALDSRYIPRPVVCMRNGGASSSGWTSYRQGLKDRRKALRKNGVYTNYALLSLGYAKKIISLIAFKLSHS